ncbi:MAG: fructose-bisphosphate aldolase, class I [Parcubacteria group bacterium Athens0714_24]|nr:MAG: fructose-bisphosphate aldolase, class I [Parcubacteria group bacterium Athens0714_24]
MISLSKITKNGKAMYLAYDQGLEHGPEDFNLKNFDPNKIIEIAIEGKFTAIILQKGLTEKYYTNSQFRKKIPLILKLNGKTKLYEGEAFSPQECDVAEAIRLGASAVGYTIYPGSQFEAKMIKEFGNVVKEAHERGIPAIAWVYPRGKDIVNDVTKEVVAYAARVGLELGADIVKIKYSGSLENFKWAVQCAGKTKVVLSGGPKVSDEEFLEVVKNVMSAGAIGVAVGRNVWQNENPLKIAEEIRKTIFT